MLIRKTHPVMIRPTEVVLRLRDPVRYRMCRPDSGVHTRVPEAEEGTGGGERRRGVTESFYQSLVIQRLGTQPRVDIGDVHIHF